MTNEYTPEEIKRRLSNIGEAIGEIALKYIFELEKTNAELRKKIGVYQIGMFKEIEKRDVKLTKAEEFLNEFVRISKASDEDFEHDFSELIAETENFLKELNK